MVHSTHLNPQSYEFGRIKAEYDNLLEEYTKIKNNIKYRQGKLKDYINDKDKMNKYIKLRQERKNDN